MSNKDLKLAIELAAKATGREEIAALGKEVGNLGPVSSDVEKETKALAQRLQQLGQQRDLIDAVNKSSDAIDNLSAATVLSRDKLERLRQEQASAGGDAAAMAEKEKLLASEVRQLQSQLVKQATTHTKLSTELKQSGVDTANLGLEQRRLQKEIASASDSAAKLGNDLTGARAGASGLASGVGNLTRNLLSMAGAYVGISALKDQLLAMFKSGDQAEQLSVQLQAVMGSIQGGKEATAWIQNFAQTTPLQLDEVTKTFVRLKAFGLDPMSGTMQSVVDQAYKLGGGFEAVEGISLALGQAWAKQKLQGEEILQLIERGVPVWELLEKVTGKNTAELQKLSSAGELGRDAIKALMDEMGRSSQGAAVANMSTMSGLISNARDNLEKFYRLVAENGALDWLKQQLVALNNEFARMAADGSLQQWAKRISDAVVTAGESIKAMAKWIYDWSTALKVLGEAWLGLKMASWAGQIKTLVAQFIAIPAATTAAAGGLTTMSVAAAAATPVLRLFGAALKGLAAAVIVESIANIIKMANAMTQWIKAELALRESQQLQAETASQLKKTYEDLSRQTGVTISSMSEFDELVRTGAIHMDEATGKWMKGPVVLKSIGDQAQQTAAELSNYESQINAAARSTVAMADADLAGIFEKAKLDIDQISGGVGKTVAEFASGLDTMAKATHVSSEAIAGYLQKAFDATTNKAELDAIIAKMTVLHQQGRLVGQPYVDSMAQATEAAKKMSSVTADGAQVYLDALKAQKTAVNEAYKTGVIGAEQHRQQVGKLNLELEKTTVAAKKNVAAADDLTKAYSDFGMQSAKALEDQAAKLKASFQTIQSGAQPLEQVKEAFLKYAEAELTSAKANDRYANGALSAQAATLGLSSEFDSLEKSVAATGKEALITAGALDTLGASSKKAGADVATAGQNVDQHAEGMKKLQAHTREASAGQLTFADVMMKSSEVAGLSLDDINTKMSEAKEIWESSYNYLLKSNDLSTEWWEPFVEKQLLAQKHNMQLLDQMQNLKVATEALSSAELPTARLVANAERAVRQADLLDSETLANFRSAIDSARQKMESLNSSASSTLSNLRDELDQMNQNYAAVEERRYQTQIAELRTKLAEAEAAGSKAAVSDLEQALSIAEQLHQQKMTAIRAEAAEKQAAAQKEAQSKTAAAATPSNTPVVMNQPTPATPIAREITINLLGSRHTIKTDAAGDAALESVLRQLESVGAITK